LVLAVAVVLTGMAAQVNQAGAAPSSIPLDVPHTSMLLLLLLLLVVVVVDHFTKPALNKDCNAWCNQLQLLLVTPEHTTWC
jgi:hypothetical protein